MNILNTDLCVPIIICNILMKYSPVHRASITPGKGSGTSVKPEHSKGVRPAGAIIAFTSCYKSRLD